MSDQLISIPEYMTRFINPNIDLNATPKICCPFHDEDTPSFSYSAAKGVWRCFGACKVGGDVVALHQKHHRLKTRAEAEDSLYKLLGLAVIKRKPQKVIGVPDESAAAFHAAVAKAVMVATTVEDWVELDYLMGQYPPDLDKLEIFYNSRRSSV